MPYIAPGLRHKIDAALEPLLRDVLKDATPGELNYALSRIIWAKWYMLKRYSNANELVGVLECVKAEFLRRHVAPYEDNMQTLNGDLP